MLGELRQELSRSHQDISRSYQELRGDLRDLTLRVEVLEQRQRSQDSLHAEITDLRSDFDRLRDAADRFVQDHVESSSSIQQRLQRIEVGIGAILIGYTGSSDPFGGASSSQHSRPPPHATPRPTPSRPPFSSIVHLGTGFPEPSTRVGVSSRIHSSRG